MRQMANMKDCGKHFNCCFFHRVTGDEGHHPLFLLKHKIIQVGRNFRRCLVPPPAERMLYYEVTSGCSAFNPVWSWKHAGLETFLGRLSLSLTDPIVNKLFLPTYKFFKFSFILLIYFFFPLGHSISSSSVLPNLKRFKSVFPASWINLIIFVIWAVWVGRTVLPIEIVLLGRKNSMNH